MYINLSAIVLSMSNTSSYHGSKREKTKANKLMYTSNDDTQNSLPCRLLETFGDTQLIESKVPKVVKPTNKKTLLKTLGTGLINSSLSPLQ